MSSGTNSEAHNLEGWRMERAVPGALEDCCLIVATFQRPDEILQLFEAIYDNSSQDVEDTPASVIVVDGARSSETEKRLLEWLGNRELAFDVYYLKSPAGLTRQRNVGIDCSGGDYVFFLDDDSIPLPGYFREVRRVFVEDADHSIGAVGGAVINDFERPLSLRWRLRLALGLAERGEPMMYQKCGTSVPKALAKPFSGTRDVDLMSGCAMSYRREVLEQCRFSSFFDGYSQGEDLEMSLRVGRSHRVVVSGDARIIHNQAPGGRPTSFAKGKMEIRNRLYIWNRYGRSGAGVRDRIRLGADFLFVCFMDIAYFVRRPWQPYHLAHAAGVVSGILNGIASGRAVSEPRPHPSSRANWRLLSPGETHAIQAASVKTE